MTGRGPNAPPLTDRERRQWFWGTVYGVALVILFVIGMFIPKACHAQRTYWPVPLDSAAIGHFRKHTHVQLTGRVGRVAKETDGDLHIQLIAPSGAFVICECTPKEPCQAPKLGTTITVRGISRQDSEHGWFELHPVKSWTLVAPTP